MAFTDPLSLNHVPVTSNVSTVFEDVEVSGDYLLTLLPSNLNVLDLNTEQLKNSQIVPQVVEVLPGASMVSKSFFKY